MEVHQVRSPAKEKHFKHYLFEFLMLFLAVTAGFFMENQRDHYAEKKREKQFIRSLAEDLKKDIRELDKKINLRDVRKMHIDSIISILNSPDPDQYGNQLYYFARYLPRPYRFEFNDGTLQQLKSSGNLRLIEDQAVVDTILSYDHSVHNIEWIESREEQNVLRVFPLLIKLFDPNVFNGMNVLDAEFTRPPEIHIYLRKIKLFSSNF